MLAIGAEVSDVIAVPLAGVGGANGRPTPKDLFDSSEEGWLATY
ncbi:MAG: hypothetical protein NTX77_09525 [Actinobacteria bacterium]|nr:hypothetical protein [Actinomycetota bacterium]